jgi:very-short-patch-repair endonuclease
MRQRISSDLDQLLARQSGVFARWQLPANGPELSVVAASARSGQIQRLYTGVYTVFLGPPGRRAQQWAAVLRLGPGAALSYQSAAELDGFAPEPSRLMHVTVLREKRMVRVPGIVMHRSARLAVARHPSKTPPRTRVEETALDLAQAAANLDDAFAWISRPCARRLTKPSLLIRAMNSRSRVRWRAELMAALCDVAEGLLSPLERRYVRNVERPHGLPRAKRQVLIVRGSERQYLDNHYEEFGIGVELDGQAYHPAEERWRDISRDNALGADGVLVLRYGWGDVTDRPCQAAAQIGTAARKRGWPGRLIPCGPACVVPRP